jgi:hypothetical protein
LFVANLIGGAPEAFSVPIATSKSAEGGGTALLSLPLSQTLGLDPAAQWQFTFNVHYGLEFGPPTPYQVIATDGTPPWCRSRRHWCCSGPEYWPARGDCGAADVKGSTSSSIEQRQARRGARRLRAGGRIYPARDPNRRWRFRVPIIEPSDLITAKVPAGRPKSGTSSSCWRRP